jgi:para-nitrobenzyl esterase
MTHPSAPVVSTTSGKVRGTWRPGSAAFLGIPYAAAPVGPLRFAAPAPVEPWDGVRDATRPGPTPQRRGLGGPLGIPEPSIPGADVLNLNVFTPAPDEPDRRLPVLVWIHGGGFTAGSPASPWYDGASFNRDGVVTVVISYRLGFDGFGWIEDAPLNRGVLDMIAALEWVRDNVTAFGGDPAQVTIGGQSAGGTSVLALLTCSAAQELFRAVACSSGTGRTQDAAAAQRLGREMASAAGVLPTRAGWAELSEDAVLDVQARYGMRPPSGVPDPVALVRGVLFGRDNGPGFGPVVDGVLLSHPVEEALALGIGVDKPLLIGANAHEFNAGLAGARSALASLDVATALADAGLPQAIADRYVAQHPELVEPAFLLGQVITDALFRMPLTRFLAARAAGGGAACTWAYDFRWRSPVLGLSMHCIDLPFAWDLLGADGVVEGLGEAPPQFLADAMHRAWVRFVRENEPGWRPWVHGAGVVFDQESSERAILEPERELAAVLSARAGGTAAVG